MSEDQGLAPTDAQSAERYPGVNAPGSGGRGSFVYAVGRLSPQFSSLGVEKEFTQLTGASARDGLMDVGRLRQVLDVAENRYLARHLCWVFSAHDVDLFIVVPYDDADVSRLVETISPDEPEEMVHVVLGRFHPILADLPCAAAGLPAVTADQLLTFTLSEFAQALPGADAPAVQGAADEQEPPAEDRDDDRGRSHALVREVFARLTRRADNYGITDDHRAFNYVALRYPAIYHAVAQAYREGKWLVSIDGRHRHSTHRRLVAVRLTFRHGRSEITERYQCLVDVTDEFPFLTSPLIRVYE